MSIVHRMLVASSFVVVLSGCKDRGQKSADEARADVQALIELSARDVAEVQRGLPEGASKLAALLTKELGKDGDPKQNTPAVRSALVRMRAQVPDLGIAKSTFFALADDKGIVLRNDAEQDSMAGKELFGLWPASKAVAAGATPYATGTVQLFSAPKADVPDKDWVAASPVSKSEGGRLGVLVTGWSYRRFAYHLQFTRQRELQDRLVDAGELRKMPILYVCLFDQTQVYCARGAGVIPVPEVNEKALASAGLFAKTAGGMAAEPLKIENRDFGWAAARAPALGPEVGIVVLRSEI